MKSLFEQHFTDDPIFPYEAREAMKSKGIEKTAAVGSAFLQQVWKATPPAVAAGAVAGAAGIATEALARGTEGLYHAVQKGRTFRTMLQKNPDLRELDAHQVREQFNTIYSFSPSAARSPMAAGSWIRMLNSQQIEGRQMIPPETVRDLVGIEQSMASARAARGGLGKQVAQAVSSSLGKQLAPASPRRLPRPRKK